MRISDLSRRCEVSIATIKFYLREGLLAPGTPTAHNQAAYGESHVERLRLIRVLTGMGMMSLASVREVLTAVDDPGTSPDDLATVVSRALYAEPSASAGVRPTRPARAQVDRFIGAIGWDTVADATGRSTLTTVLAALGDLDGDCDAEVFAPYAEAAGHLASHQRVAAPHDTPATIVERTVLFEVAFAALRRMAYSLTRSTTGTR